MSGYQKEDYRHEEHRESKTGGMGLGADTTGLTGTGTTGLTGTGTTAPMSTGGLAQNPATGETHMHSTKTGAAADQAWQDVKSKVPGTKEHKATKPTIM